ncbi:ABC transporter permease [Thalassotalea insulae]|uniref:ABC transporter permease n=1 Tax=Thalassotalea insulae TaxID=2056778 RepID=A0ABQ6H0A9_9GAMM|nr:ABC transporter permease [Thalassotalea insulae]GLX80170.1 ABC transporter permease [Thalassotalea insulae]
MRVLDNLQFCYIALVRHKIRTGLLLLAVAIGVTSVLLLTSLGEGARLFIEQEFSSLGNQMLVVLPGKKETTGGAVPIYGTSPRDLTIDDANALNQLPSVETTAPIIAGTALVNYQGLSREVITIGSSAAFFEVRQLKLQQGKILPQNSNDRASAVCVLGYKLKKLLFGQQQALGQWLKIGGQRFRVIGVLEERGESMGLDMRDMAIIPIRSAESLFNAPSLFRIVLTLKQAGSESYTEKRIREVIAKRHDGEDDISIVSQNALLNSFNNIITLVTAAIGAIAAISLIVAGFLIMNVCYVSVSRRKSEIGLLKALGASKNEVRRLFLTESVILVSIGVTIGVLVGYSLVFLAHQLWPGFPLRIPWWATISSTLLAAIIGILFSWLPASMAAKQDPVIALRGS